MPRRKRRTFQQIMEEQSMKILREKLPEEWVIHEYKPDYGIDVIVEVFKYVDDTKEVAETLGELFFAQVKSIKTTKIEQVKVYPHFNVEKRELAEDKTKSTLLDVIKFEIETTELATVQAMGPAIPVLLILVALDTEKIYFVCLNDYIDKVLEPRDPKYYEDEHKIIYIPVRNEIGKNYELSAPLALYARRSKMYGAFTKFQYQWVELQYLRSTGNADEEVNFDADELVSVIKRFAQTAKQQDIWQNLEWYPIGACYEELLSIEKLLQDSSASVEQIFAKSIACWHLLNNLSSMYEELCREWFLPTFGRN
jgi:hypothetical protein